MAAHEVLVRGAITPDGRLILDEQPDLPAGRVEVVVRPVEEAESVAATLLEVLQPIWDQLDATGFGGGRSLEEAVADVRAMRDEWAEHDRQLEELRERCRAHRETDSAQAEDV